MSRTLLIIFFIIGSTQSFAQTAGGGTSGGTGTNSHHCSGSHSRTNDDQDSRHRHDEDEHEKDNFQRKESHDEYTFLGFCNRFRH